MPFYYYFFKVSKAQLGRSAAALLEEEVGARKIYQKPYPSPSSTPQWPLKGALGFYKQIPSGVEKEKMSKIFSSF